MSRRAFLRSSCGMAATLTALAACSSEEAATTTSRAPSPTGTEDHRFTRHDAGAARGRATRRPGTGGTFTLPPESTIEEAAATTVLAGGELVVDVQTHLLEYEPGTGEGWGLGLPAGVVRRRPGGVHGDRRLARPRPRRQRHRRRRAVGDPRRRRPRSAVDGGDGARPPPGRTARLRRPRADPGSRDADHRSAVGRTRRDGGDRGRVRDRGVEGVHPRGPVVAPRRRRRQRVLRSGAGPRPARSSASTRASARPPPRRSTSVRRP